MQYRKTISLLIALIMCVLVFPVSASARTFAFEEMHAQALKELGLFKGVSDTDFDLERPATRVEAIVMLIRLIGCENDALSNHYWHPFTDVPAWANDYIGYAYTNGLANGISATEFGTGDVTAAMYLTFALRALGYDDKNGDFSWSNPYDLAKEANLIRWNVDLDNFLRADIATISLATLEAPQKEYPLAPLADWLIYKGVFTYDQYYYALTPIGESVGNLALVHTLSSDTQSVSDSGTRSVENITDDSSIGQIQTITQGYHIKPHSGNNPYLGTWEYDIPLYDADGKYIFIVNTNSGKIHYQDCDSVSRMSNSNKAVTVDPYDLIAYNSAFAWCQNCGYWN